MPDDWKINMRTIIDRIKDNVTLQNVGIEYLSEELLPTDIDRKDDDMTVKNNEEFICFEDQGITKDGKINKNGIKIKVQKEEKSRNIFKYFIDGTLKTVYLGEVVYPNVFPLMFTEVASACLERDSMHKLHKKLFKNQNYLIFPFSLVPDTLLNQLLNINNNSILFVDSTNYKTENDLPIDLRERAGAIARYKMHEIEIDVMNEITKEIETQKTNYMAIIDGSISNIQFVTSASDKIIALTKSPSFKPLLRFGQDVMKVGTLLSALDYAERTVVFKKENVNVLVWYIRIFKRKNLSEPLEGIVKIEFPLPKNFDPEILSYKSSIDEVKKLLDKINNISSAILYETFVNSYPNNRWSSNIYPIAKTEDFMKTNMKSILYIRGSIKW
ncbi:hypothetical protein ACAG39_01805 [Caldicellulosiruptoraceae bacterium PP1]